MNDSSFEREAAITPRDTFAVLVEDADDVKLLIARERRKDVTRIERDAQALGEIQTDIASLVTRQSEGVFIISDNVELASAEVSEAVNFLREREKKDNRYRALTIGAAVISGTVALATGFMWGASLYRSMTRPNTPKEDNP